MQEERSSALRVAGILPRFVAVFWDWLLISAYLVILLVVALAIYRLVLGEIPDFTSYQAQLVATLASVIPVIAAFSIMEGTRRSASWGKRRVGLEVRYDGPPIRGSIIRNTVKFLPWQFGHMGTIDGLYNGFEAPFSTVFLSLAIALPIIYIAMVLIRRDRRHLGDLLAGSTVVESRA